MKKIASRFAKSKPQSITTMTRPKIPVKQEESTDMILNRLISGSGIKKDEKLCKLIICMAFRSSEYLQRNELVRYQLDDVIRLPGDNQHQIKNGFKFTINDRSSFYDW